MLRGLLRGLNSSEVIHRFFQVNIGFLPCYGVSSVCHVLKTVSQLFYEVLLASATIGFFGKAPWLYPSKRERSWTWKIMETLLHTPKTACQVLGISRSTLYRLIADGQIEVTRVRSLPRFTEASLKRFVERKVSQTREQAVGF